MGVEKNTVSKETNYGRCLCGAVQFEIRGPLRHIVNCHCQMCQRLHGSFGAHTKAKKDHIIITKDSGLSWYKTSNVARRGFCNQCGSSLFWEPFDMNSTGILAGAINDTSMLKTMGHIFTSEKAKFYQITDDLTQYEKSSDGGFPDDFT